MTSVNALRSIRLSVKGNYTKYILNIFRVLLAHLKSIVWANLRLITNCCYVLSVVWHLSLSLMNSFNKIEAAVFQCRLWFLGAFSFISLIMTRKCTLQITQQYFTDVNSIIFYKCFLKRYRTIRVNN